MSGSPAKKAAELVIGPVDVEEHSELGKLFAEEELQDRPRTLSLDELMVLTNWCITVQQENLLFHLAKRYPWPPCVVGAFAKLGPAGQAAAEFLETAQIPHTVRIHCDVSHIRLSRLLQNPHAKGLHVDLMWDSDVPAFVELLQKSPDLEHVAIMFCKASGDEANKIADALIEHEWLKGVILGRLNCSPDRYVRLLAKSNLERAVIAPHPDSPVLASEHSSAERGKVIYMAQDIGGAGLELADLLRMKHTDLAVVCEIGSEYDLATIAAVVDRLPKQFRMFEVTLRENELALTAAFKEKAGALNEKIRDAYRREAQRSLHGADWQEAVLREFAYKLAPGNTQQAGAIGEVLTNIAKVGWLEEKDVIRAGRTSVSVSVAGEEKEKGAAAAMVRQHVDAGMDSGKSKALVGRLLPAAKGSLLSSTSVLDVPLNALEFDKALRMVATRVSLLSLDVGRLTQPQVESLVDKLKGNPDLKTIRMNLRPGASKGASHALVAALGRLAQVHELEIDGFKLERGQPMAASKENVDALARLLAGQPGVGPHLWKLMDWMDVSYAHWDETAGLLDVRVGPLSPEQARRLANDLVAMSSRGTTRLRFGESTQPEAMRAMLDVLRNTKGSELSINGIVLRRGGAVTAEALKPLLVHGPGVESSLRNLMTAMDIAYKSPAPLFAHTNRDATEAYPRTQAMRQLPRHARNRAPGEEERRNDPTPL